MAEKRDPIADTEIPGQPPRETETVHANRTLIVEGYERGLSFYMLTVGLMAVVLIVALDNYIISTAIPRITSQFNGLGLAGWYSSSYFLTLMALQPAFGQICTLFPVKGILLASIVIFEIGSVLSAAAQNSAAFLAGRLISGAAGGGLWCGSLTVMTLAVETRKRHLYISVVTSMYGLASVAGPVLSGVFTDSSTLTWRFCFWINLPIGGIAFIIIWLALPAGETTGSTGSQSVLQRLSKIDFWGIVLMSAIFICLLLALQWGGMTYVWSDSVVWGCLLGAGLMGCLFVALQVRLGDRATISPRILSKRTPAAGSLFTILISMGIVTHVYYLPFYFQSAVGTSASGSGVRLLAYLMVLLFTPMITGSLITLVGHYVPFMLLGCALFTTGAGLLTTLEPDSSPGKWAGYQVLAAFGAGLCRQMAFTAVPLVLPPEDLPTATALVAFCNSVGSTLALGIGQAIFAQVLSKQLRDNFPGVDIQSVLHAGAADLVHLVPAAELPNLRLAFNDGVSRTFILAVASGGLAFCTSLAMDWINVKKHGD